MAKPEWGTKRVCQSCGAHFYDLRRSSIRCPKCGSSFDPDASLRGRKSRPPAPAERVAVVAPVVVAEAPPEDEAPAGEEEAEEEKVGEELIEDVSELGEDSEDVSEVLDGVEDGAET